MNGTVSITISVSAVESGEPHITIDTRPNEACLPPGVLKDIVERMLAAATDGPGWRKTIDARGVPLKLAD